MLRKISMKRLLGLAVTACIILSSVTPVYASSTKNDTFDKNNYELFDWQPTKNSYWFPLDTDYPTTLMTAKVRPEWNNYPSFIGSAKRFTKKELPVGTVIELDKGYYYLPATWTDDKTQKVSAKMTNESKVVIDEAWWGDYTYRAFNLFKEGAPDISNDFKEASSHLRIYVPKQDTKAVATKAPEKKEVVTKAPEKKAVVTKAPEKKAAVTKAPVKKKEVKKQPVKKQPVKKAADKKSK